jgi:polar amino acid transport system substrate-binding protein
MNRPTLCLLGALMLILLSACTPSDQSLDAITSRGVMHVGMDASYPPFEYVTPQGEIVGFDVDLAQAIAERLGVGLKVSNISYDGLYDALLVGEVDMLISALVVAEGRANFSDPYFNIGQHLVVPLSSDAVTMADLSGRTLAVEYGSGGDVEARAWQRRIASLEVARHATPDEAISAVRSGQADAALVDGITAHLAQGQYDDIIIATNVDDSLVAVATHPESSHLVGRINDILSDLRADGTLDRLIEKWFGS